MNKKTKSVSFDFNKNTIHIIDTELYCCCYYDTCENIKIKNNHCCCCYDNCLLSGNPNYIGCDCKENVYEIQNCYNIYRKIDYALLPTYNLYITARQLLGDEYLQLLNLIYKELNNYKKNEMFVHPESRKYVYYHKI